MSGLENRTIDINVLSVTSIDKAIKAVREYKRELDARAALFVERLQEVGIEAACMYFEKAAYAGEPDVLVDLPKDVTKKGHTYTARVRATGDTVLFIEFGTGIYHENAHQLEYGYYAGSYGRQALQPWGWFYSGSPGSHPPRGTEMAHGHPRSVHTYGNPANMPMYNTRRHLLVLFASIAEEVFCR